MKALNPLPSQGRHGADTGLPVTPLPCLTPEPGQGAGSELVPVPTEPAPAQAPAAQGRGLGTPGSHAPEPGFVLCASVPLCGWAQRRVGALPGSPLSLHNLAREVGVRSGGSTFPRGLRGRSRRAREWAGGPPPTTFKQQWAQGRSPAGQGAGPVAHGQVGGDGRTKLPGRHCRKPLTSPAHRPESC